jgi:hypothetical protein
VGPCSGAQALRTTTYLILSLGIEEQARILHITRFKHRFDELYRCKMEERPKRFFRIKQVSRNKSANYADTYNGCRTSESAI